MASAGATMYGTPRVQFPRGRAHPLPLQNSLYTNSVHLKLRSVLAQSPMSFCERRSGSGSIRSSLIAPDGGKLVNLIVPESQREAKRKQAGSMPQIRLSRIDLEWAHVVSEGWASPLGGFMRQTEFLQTLHFNFLRLQDGSIVNMSVPIVLAIDDLQKEAIGHSNDVALLDPNGNLVAILKNYCDAAWSNLSKVDCGYVSSGFDPTPCPSSTRMLPCQATESRIC